MDFSLFHALAYLYNLHRAPISATTLLTQARRPGTPANRYAANILVRDLQDSSSQPSAILRPAVGTTAVPTTVGVLLFTWISADQVRVRLPASRFEGHYLTVQKNGDRCSFSLYAGRTWLYTSNLRYPSLEEAYKAGLKSLAYRNPHWSSLSK